ncbi:serine/threonine-protein kinase [Glutamicibacter sp.]|uniref:serine/threonine-protein kinase n=1 Tax=Glutamicibacter sp. TaxID=1931995 RepID=UPI0028BEAADB|nr:serine/threonine-protein kinase [Glutamicibacter sp.]
MPEVVAGRFELIEHIAQGGSGSVWLARDLQVDQLCAAKVMRQSYSGELLRFVREQGVKFDHEHLLTPYGWAAVDDQVVIASRLMRGGNLHTALADYGAFSQELTAEILVQLLDGLAHVHESGWVHRDVKAANVLLEMTGVGVPQVRLADFGIAAHRDAPRLTELGMTVGTEGYLAPELLLGADPHPAGDLYALGVLGTKLMGRKAEGALQSVISGLLDDDPQVRVRTASSAPQMLQSLRNSTGYQVASGDDFEVFDHFEQEAAEPTRKRPAEPAPKSTRSLPWILAGIAVLLGVLALWLVFGGQPEDTAPSPSPTASVTASESSSPTAGASTSPSPSSLDVGITSNVESGQECKKLEEGLLVTGENGAKLLCEREGAGYQWRPAH